MAHLGSIQLFKIFLMLFIIFKISKSEKCSESREKHVLLKYLFFLKICPAETIASLLTILDCQYYKLLAQENTKTYILI